jgi:PAS domain S-box-containing protein
LRNREIGALLALAHPFFLNSVSISNTEQDLGGLIAKARSGITIALSKRPDAISMTRYSRMFHSESEVESNLTALHVLKTLLLGGGILVVIVQSAVLAILFSRPESHPSGVVVGLGMLNGLLGIAAISTARSPWLQLRWRTVVWIVAASLIMSGGLITESTGQVELFLQGLMALLLVNAVTCDCGRRWFASLSAVAIGSFAHLSLNQPLNPMDWLTLLIAVGGAHIAQEQSRRIRRETEKAQGSLETNVAELDAAERKLRESEMMLRKIFEASPDCIALARASDGAFTAVNESVIRHFGFTPEEAIGKTQQELELWADLGQTREFMRRLRTESLVTSMELSLRRKDGTIAPFLMSAAMTEIGAEHFVVSILREITDLKRTEQELVRARRLR